jgi:hypothetical protein
MLKSHKNAVDKLQPHTLSAKRPIIYPDKNILLIVNAGVVIMPLTFGR